MMLINDEELMVLVKAAQMYMNDSMAHCVGGVYYDNMSMYESTLLRKVVNDINSHYNVDSVKE